jgi:cystathionine beta-lyase/cystathionine gamma-synthase
MGQEIRGVTLFQMPDNEMELDESIVRLKELTQRLNVETLLNPTQQSIDVTIEIINLIKGMNIPIRMTGEGLA